MKKTKLKILLTNISRIIMSILFINITLPKFVNAKIDIYGPTGSISCYATGPSEPNIIKSVFILLVPLVLIGILIAFIVHKIKSKNTKK